MNILELIERLEKIAMGPGGLHKKVSVLNLYSSVKPSEAHSIIDQENYVVITTEEEELDELDN